MEHQPSAASVRNIAQNYVHGVPLTAEWDTMQDAVETSRLVDPSGRTEHINYSVVVKRRNGRGIFRVFFRHVLKGDSVLIQPISLGPVSVSIKEELELTKAFEARQDILV